MHAMIVFQTLAGNKDIFITRNTINDLTLYSDWKKQSFASLPTRHYVPYFIHDRSRPNNSMKMPGTVHK